MSAVAETAPVLDRARLAKVLTLLGSPVGGEIYAAAHQACAMVKAAGLSWEQVLSDESRARAQDLPDHVLVQQCLAKLDFLDRLDADFVRSMERTCYRLHQLSHKQRHRLQEIVHGG